MEYRSLGRSGLRVSAVGLGGNNFGRTGTITMSQDASDAVVNAALDAGINFIDTADVYGHSYGVSESMLGVSLKGRRDQMVIASKFGHETMPTEIEGWGARGSRRYIRLAVEGSLRRLQTEWIDLYQLHTPDPNTPIDETLRALDELITEGKVRYIGHSNLAGWQIAQAEYVARELGVNRFISAQNEYNLLARAAEADVLPAARAFELGFLPWFPLANGLLTGKFHREGNPADTRLVRQRPHLIEGAPWDRIEAFREFATAREITMLDATMGFLLSESVISSVIAGATKPEQVAANAAAATRWRPSAAEREEISALFA